MTALPACGPAVNAGAVDNDNVRPAGTIAAGTLTLRLEVRSSLWHPEGPAGIAIAVPTFAEEGRAAEVPGPLIRVPAGTRIALQIRNRLQSQSVTIHGLHDRPGHADHTLALAPGATTHADFVSGPPGTFFYWATTTGAPAPLTRKRYNGMLTGAFIVDAAHGPPAPVDRVFILGDWTDEDNPTPVPALKDLETLVINGRSWPATERLTYPVNQPIHWRVINVSTEDHPMHLHGTYFSVDEAGDESDGHVLATGERPKVVTHLIESGRTIAMTWTPSEPGHWLFHCHILFHVDPALRMTPSPASPAHADHDHATDDPERHMAGLVLGVNVLPATNVEASRDASNPRAITLEVGERPGIRFPTPDKPGESWPALGYRVMDSGHESALPPFVSPGPTLVLTRGTPVAISVVNRLSKATTVHWHGIELESYYDGVSGVGGAGDRRTPVIAPGATFVARFTPPRAGTFMYHTHLNDYEQLSTGLYGALVVVEPGEKLDPNLDRVFVLSRGGPDDAKDPVLINGSEWPAEQELRTGVTYRLRFAGITPAPGVTVSIRSGGNILTWQPLAKDGARFASARPPAPATFKVQPGETYDFTFTPAAAGPLRLVAAIGRLHTEMTLRVR